MIFVASALGVIPTAALMGRATEELAARSGPGIGGLLNVTFGNAPEIIIALFALNAGLHEVVKASLIGSILGNILLVMGAAMLVGGFSRDGSTSTAPRPRRSRRCCCSPPWRCHARALRADRGHRAAGRPTPSAINYDSTVEQLSLAVAIVLILSYVAGLIFSLRTHKDLFNPAAPTRSTTPTRASRGPCARRSSRWPSPAPPSASCPRSSSARSPRRRRASASASSSSA